MVTIAFYNKENGIIVYVKKSRTHDYACNCASMDYGFIEVDDNFDLADKKVDLETGEIVPAE